MPTVRTQGAGGGGQAGSSGGGQGSGGGGSGGGNGTAPGQRTTFRPPWIKEGPEPLPMPAAPWTLARARDRRTSKDEPAAEPPAATPPRKQSKITIVPSQPAAQENGVDPNGLKKDVVSAATKKQQQQKAPEPTSAKPNDAAQERKINIQVESKQRSEPKPEAKAPPKPVQKAEPKVEPKPPPKPEPKEAKKPPAPREPRRPPEPPQPTPLSRSRSNRSATNLAPLPPPMPAPPPPPPPPDFKKDPLSKAQEQKLQKLRTGRTRKRPDWSAMMKEVEQGLRLRHVQCNDRSQPLLPLAKVKGQFMYDSEKPNVHNLLLKEIQSGIRLKRVKCNDRSRPVLEGLRKFRRQLTIEEQAQQAQEEPDAAAEPDELDDIDTLRDDLQSTKQMLALELRNREAGEKENKRLQARILNLEVELEEERKRKAAGPAEEGGAKKSLEAEKAAERLREQLSDANKHTHELEQQVHEAELQADVLRAELEELRRRNATLERRVSNAGKDQPLAKQPSAKKLNKSMSAVNAAANAMGAAPAPDEEEEEEEEETETETESEEEDSSEDEEKAAALREKRQAREMKLLSTKVRSLKEKQDTTRNERRALRLALRNQTKALKEERKKYKKLQKEVDKMAKLMKEDDDEEEEEEEEEAEEEEEESEEESSTEESEEEESEGELPADAPFEDRKKNFTERAKRHDNILAALKKGNYLLKANVEKVKDDLFKQKELSLTMQEDLNSVLAELG